MLSNQEFNDYGGVRTPQPTVEGPLPYNKGTRTSFGAHTAWRRSSGMGISKASQGSFLSFDDETPASVPQSDKGASFGKA